MEAGRKLVVSVRTRPTSMSLKVSNDKGARTRHILKPLARALTRNPLDSDHGSDIDELLPRPSMENQLDSDYDSGIAELLARPLSGSDFSSDIDELLPSASTRNLLDSGYGSDINELLPQAWMRNTPDWALARNRLESDYDRDIPEVFGLALTENPLDSDYGGDNDDGSDSYEEFEEEMQEADRWPEVKSSRSRLLSLSSGGGESFTQSTEEPVNTGDNDEEFEEEMQEGDRWPEVKSSRSRLLSLSSGEGESFTPSTEVAVHTVSKDGKFEVRVDSWTKGKMLGQGSFGTVYEGMSDTGFFFAVKEVSLVEQGLRAKQCISQLEQEITLLSQFKHENIVQYFGTDQESEKLYIFLELVTQGSLQSLYNKYCLNDSHVRAYTRQILTGLKYLHDKNVMHRDIKCANILVDANGVIKLADFGLAKETSTLKELKSFQGTPHWIAPEVFNPEKSYCFPADIWSLGCTVLEMLTGRPPNGDLEWFQALWKVGNKEIPPNIPNELSTDAKDFIKRCLKIEAADRPSAAELLDHPFVKRSLSADVSTAEPPT